MINSTENKIYPAHKCLNANILTFISTKNTTSERLKARNFFIYPYFSFYEQLKFRAQLSWAWKKFYNLRARSDQSLHYFPFHHNNDYILHLAHLIRLTNIEDKELGHFEYISAYFSDASQKLPYAIVDNQICAPSQENLSSGCPTKQVSNQSTQLQRLARKSKFCL